jgi:hypothetical protein
MEHVESGNLGSWADNHLNYHVPNYVEEIWDDNVKSNLKKFKQFADGAATPEDRNIFIDFYNFYKKYASARNKEDYGDDLEGVASEKKDIVVPVYNENPPVLLNKADSEKAGWIPSDGCDDKRAVFFCPACIDDPELSDYLYDQWEALCKLAKDIEASSWRGEFIGHFGKWVFNTEGLKYGWGALLTDGKNKPYVLYGILNTTQLATRWSKRTFKTPEEVEAMRQTAFIREAPEKIRFTPEERAFDEEFDKASSAVFRKHWWMAFRLLQKYKPEHGRYYDAAILLRIRTAKQTGELDTAAALCDEFTARRPEFAGYMAMKKAQLGKKEKE